MLQWWVIVSSSNRSNRRRVPVQKYFLNIFDRFQKATKLKNETFCVDFVEFRVKMMRKRNYNLFFENHEYKTIWLAGRRAVGMSLTSVQRAETTSLSKRIKFRIAVTCFFRQKNDFWTKTKNIILIWN